MNNAMPHVAPILNAREQGAHKRLEAIAGSVLARLPKGGRPVSLAAVTASLWGAGTSQCRADTVHCQAQPAQRERLDYFLALLSAIGYMGGLPPPPLGTEK